jgi:hypothetical protein
MKSTLGSASARTSFNSSCAERLPARGWSAGGGTWTPARTGVRLLPKEGCPVNSDIAQHLRHLNGEVTALLILAHRLGKQIEAALDRIEASATAVSGINPNLQAGPLADAIWERCGRHKALVTRTRLSQRAADEDGARAVHTNGRHRAARANGAHGVR